MLRERGALPPVAVDDPEPRSIRRALVETEQRAAEPAVDPVPPAIDPPAAPEPRSDEPRAREREAEGPSAAVSPKRTESIAANEPSDAEVQQPPAASEQAPTPPEQPAAASKQPPDGAHPVRPGQELRIDLAERTGCTLRGPVAFWPNAIPGWLSLNCASGVVSGIVPEDADPVVSIGVIAANGSGATALLSVTLVVEAASADGSDAAETVAAVEAAMRSTLDALPALRELLAKGSRSGRIRMRA